MNFIFVLFGTIAASLVSFLVGAILYMNPTVSKIYKKYQKHPSMSKYSSKGKYLFDTFLLDIAIPTFIAATVYSYLKAGLYIINGNPVSIIFVYGMILAGIRVIPRFFDMSILTSYPRQLLIIELINGIVLSFVTSAVLVFMV